jgi:transcriptional regulator NrdR family protein
MKCPFCADLDNKVIDSRLGRDSLSIQAETGVSGLRPPLHHL